MIATFNQGLSNEISYEINSCSDLLNLIPDEDRDTQYKEEITMMKQLTAIDVTVTAKSVFAKLLEADYVISTITIFNDYNEMLLQVEDFTLTSCNTRLGYTDRGEVGKFASLTFLKN